MLAYTPAHPVKTGQPRVISCSLLVISCSLNHNSQISNQKSLFVVSYWLFVPNRNSEFKNHKSQFIGRPGGLSASSPPIHTCPTQTYRGAFHSYPCRKIQRTNEIRGQKYGK